MHNSRGLLAIFDHPDDLLEAAQKVRLLRVKRMDAFTPFAVHGLDEAMGIERSWIPYVTLGVGLAGWCGGFLLQAWAMSMAFPVNIGGKPPVGWPGFIPISFETMVLSAGVVTSLIMLGMIFGSSKIFESSLDPRLTDDRFGFFVARDDVKFDEAALRKIFKECYAEEIRVVE